MIYRLFLHQTFISIVSIVIRKKCVRTFVFYHPTRIVPPAIALAPEAMIFPDFVAVATFEVGFEAAAEGVAQHAIVEGERPRPVQKEKEKDAFLSVVQFTVAGASLFAVFFLVLVTIYQDKVLT